LEVSDSRQIADSVLDFPTIRPPESEWFSRVLLYWDRVGTILPRHYSRDHTFLRPYTSALLDAGLLTPIAPDDSVWHSGVRWRPERPRPPHVCRASVGAGIVRELRTG
jgi:hypothetical protein